MRVLLINPPVFAVDPYQVDIYAEAIPYGLIQIATLLADQGHDVRALDMMGRLDGGYERVCMPGNVWGTLPAGSVALRDVRRPVYRYGRDRAWLAARLAELPPPDEILVTCCMSFNYPPAFEAIAECRRAFPAARLRFGGFYPTMYPDHAARAGADEVFQGRWAAADATPARFEVWDRPPPVWLFRLVTGCRFKCSFCLNSARPAEAAGDPRAQARGLRHMYERHGTREFSNWDPNVMLQRRVLRAFLEEVISFGLPLRLKWEMGIQPGLLTRDVARLMRAAGTIAMSIPFESTDPEMLARFHKSSHLEAALRAMETAREAGYDTSRFHNCFILGVPGERLEHVFRTHLLILRYGGNPKPVPLVPSPGTEEYARHAALLEGKDHHELNGHLWPLLPDEATLLLYEQVLRVVSSNSLELARRRAAQLPDHAREVFEREADALFPPAAGAAPGALVGATHASPLPGTPRTTARRLSAPLILLPPALHALCLLCRGRSFCADKGARMQDDVRACFCPAPSGDVAASARLMADLRAAEGLDDERLVRLEHRLWRNLAHLRKTVGGGFEPSAAWDGRRWRRYRFSFSFHDRRPDCWRDDQAEALACVGTVAPDARPVARQLLGLATPPLAAQLLFGFEAQDDARRLKLYFRFAPGQAEEKRALLHRLFPAGAPAPAADRPERLHLLGFDFRAAGVTALKLYLHEACMTAETVAAHAPPENPLPALGARKGLSRWQDVVTVVRVTGEGRAGVSVSEIDVHGPRNDVTLSDLIEVAEAAPEVPDFEPVADFFARHPLVLSRLSFPWGDSEGGALKSGRGKANLYYLVVPL